MEPVIEAAGVEQELSQVRRGVVEAVRGVDIRVEAGEIFGFLGPNGAGKTTTLRMLATLLAPGGGWATVAGYDLLREPSRVRERIGYVSQAGGVDVQATGRENLVLQARLCGLGKGRGAGAGCGGDRAAGAFGGLRPQGCHVLGRPAAAAGPGAGSGPSSGAVVLRRADGGVGSAEPGAVVGRGARVAGDRCTTVFLTTHYLDEADALCDRLAIIDEGRIVAEGTPRELKRRISGDVISVTLDGTERRRCKAGERSCWARAPSNYEVQEDGGTLRVYVESGEEALPGLMRALDGGADAALGPSRCRSPEPGRRFPATDRPLSERVFQLEKARGERNADPPGHVPDTRLQSADYPAKPGLGHHRDHPAYSYGCCCSPPCSKVSPGGRAFRPAGRSRCLHPGFWF